MIEKKIHYIWLGKGNKSEVINICINSWKLLHPDFEIIEWNEERLNFYEVIKKSVYLTKCYKNNQWAFLSDYFRFKILYDNGGFYLDTDMQLIKPLYHFLGNKCFFGFEKEGIVSAGIIGGEKENIFFKEMLNFYEKNIMNDEEYMVPRIMNKILVEKFDLKDDFKLIELKNSIKIYDKEYFYPYYYNEEFEYRFITENTYGIHWWGKSWNNLSKMGFLKTKHMKGMKKIYYYYYYKLGFANYLAGSKVTKVIKKYIIK